MKHPKPRKRLGELHMRGGAVAISAFWDADAGYKRQSISKLT